MLRQRVITAVVLLLVLIVVLTVAKPWGFPAFALVAVGIVIAEWLALLGLSRQTTVVAAGVMVFVLWVVGSTPLVGQIGLWVMGIAAACWIALALFLFTTGRFPPSDRWRLPYALLALLLPSACWFALVEAYGIGLVFLLSLLAIVWAADIAAYFAGRAFGKRKLAPAISPGKTWAGAVGGAIAGMVLALVVVAIPAAVGNVFSVLALRVPLWVVLLIVAALVAMSIVGDLFESQLKRQRGVKDSGTLLPGHGGVFDRVDALLPVVPLAIVLVRLL